MDTTNSLGLKRRGRTLRPTRLVASLMASLLLLFLCNCVAAYYAPRYGEAVAETPIIGAVSSKLLQFYGVREGNVTVVNDAATSSGHTVRLVAAYADALRTVFYIEIDGKGLAGDPNAYGRRPGEFGVRYDTPTLVDQFGHSYELRGPGGANELGFEPLAWPASKVGARLTLHVDGLVELWLPPGTEGLVSGSWTLHATLVTEAAHQLPLPAPVKTPKATFTFTSIRATSTAIDIHWTTSGSIIGEVQQTYGPGIKPDTPQQIQDQERQLMENYFMPVLFDAKGNRMRSSGYGTTFAYPATSDYSAYISGTGRYRLQLATALTAPEDQVWIVVP